MSKTVEEQIEEVKTLVVGVQSKNDELIKTHGKKVADSDESIKKMEEKFGELTESIQKAADEKTAQDKTIEELTLAVARGGSKNSEKVKPEDVEMSDEVKSQFGQALRVKNSQFILDPKVMDEIVTDHVKNMFTHLTTDRQELLIKSILAEGSNGAGGIWCPTPVDARIRRRIFETSPMRELAEVINVNTQAMTFALDDEEIPVNVSGEVDVRNDTNTPEFGEVRIETDELYAKPTATLQVLEDSTLNLETWLADKVARKIARSQNKAFIVGNGTKEARGILDYADASSVEVYNRGKIGTLETAAANALAADDLIDLQSHLIEEYQSNATWLTHRLTWALTMKLKDAENRYLLDPMLLFSGIRPQLLGVDVRMAGDMPAAPAGGTLVSGTTYFAYGDFREGYTILDRLGISVIMDNITRSGFVKWYFRTRYGGGVTNFQAFKRLKAQ